MMTEYIDNTWQNIPRERSKITEKKKDAEGGNTSLALI